MTRRAWIILAALLAAGIALLWRGSRSAERPSPPVSAVAVPPAAEPDRISVTQEGITVVGGTEFDLHYGGPEGSVSEDLQQVSALLDAAFLLVKDSDRRPLADNVDFTAFLQGGNPHRVAWIRPGHPAVSDQGELLDRDGNALFFHQESSRRIVLRSAGPDGSMWTGDDVVWPEE